MTYIVLEKVELTTGGGYPAEIYGIDPSESYCLVGKLNSEYGGAVRWNMHGMCRDQDDKCNFDTRTEAFQEVQKIAKALVKNG